MTTLEARIGARNAAIIRAREARPALPPWMCKATPQPPASVQHPMSRTDHLYRLLVRCADSKSPAPYRWQIAEKLDVEPSVIWKMFDVLKRRGVQIDTQIVGGNKPSEYAARLLDGRVVQTGGMRGHERVD